MKDKDRVITTFVFVGAALLLLVANVATGVLLIRQYRSAMRTLIESRMLDITDTAADMIDGDAYERITERDESNPEYVDIYKTLEYFQENIDLEFIYGIRDMKDGTYIFTVDPAKEDCSEYGELVHFTDALYEASQGTHSVDKQPYTDDYGTFISAYSPIYNSKGEIVGVVAVDFAADWVEKQIDKNRLTIVIGCIVTVFIGALALVIVRLIVSKIRAKNTDKQANSMITALASDYRSVYYVNLDDDSGICYRSHSKLEDGLAEGERFHFKETFEKYAKDYISEDYREQFLQFISPDSIRESLATEPIIALTYLTIRNGVESYEMLRMAGVRRPEERDDHKVHAVGVGFTDVDNRTRANLEQKQALIDALAVAEEASKAKTAFLSSMSHEIRTPLNAIIGLDRIAMSDANISDKTKDYLEQIGDSARHLLKVINNILDMSRIESGHLTLAHEEFSFRRLIEQVDVMIGVQSYDKGVKFEMNVDEELNRYYVGDEMKIKQILVNILGNAVKFTETGGRVTFLAEKTAVYNGHTTVRFTMKDTGIGIDENYLPKLFEPFSQEDASTTNKYGSTGLGMSITKNYVDMLNGSIDVDSTKDVGTTFVVTLTLEDSDRMETPEEKESVTNSKKILDGCRVLLAEDIAVNAMIMVKILNMRNIIVEHAENGRIAVEMFADSEEGYYDAILMDMRMPEMDGLEATEMIRNMDRRDSKKIPIIAVTANAFDEDVQNSLQAGLNAHLSKPVEPNEVYKILESLITE